MPSYQARQLRIIDAYHWRGDFEELKAWAGPDSDIYLDAGQLKIATVQGVVVPVEQGEWVVREAASDRRFYPIDHAVFEETYQPVEEKT